VPATIVIEGLATIVQIGKIELALNSALALDTEAATF
jgi:hypothetical protein